MTLNKLRRQLAFPRASFQLGILGVITGFFSALLIVCFRLLINETQGLFSEHVDNFTHLPPSYRWISLIIGAMIIAVVIDLSASRHTRLGIPFVLHKIRTAYGIMPGKNAINQFIGGAAALISGFSVGREGPSVHLGAYASSWIGNGLKLPYNSIRILSSCGIAAGISASFNTPLAAVIFVMEVILRDYRIHAFIPIMLSAVIGALVTRFVFGDSYELELIQVMSLSHLHYPLLILCGLLIGAVAFTFNNNLMRLIQFSAQHTIYLRLTVATIVTGIVGTLVPQALGSGVGAIQFSVSDPSALSLLLGIFAGKFIATLFALGLGIPGGIIGPVLGLGVVLGTILGSAGFWIQPELNVYGSYAVICMAGLMAASLHAPLAALVTVLELTRSPEIIAPTMLVVATSFTTSAQFFRARSIFLQQLIFQKLPYQLSPAEEMMQKVGVLAKLDTNYRLIETASEQEIKHYMSTIEMHEHLIIKEQYEIGADFKLASYDVNLASGSDDVEIKLQPLQGINAQSTLAEAFNILQDARDGAVYVYQDHIENIIGIIHWDQLRRLLTKRNNLL